MSKTAKEALDVAPSTRTMILNAAVAFVAAQLVVVLLHEASHVVAGLALGQSNVLYPFGVTHSPEPDRRDAAITALVGPAFSLLTGLLAMTFMPWRRSRGSLHLAWLWFAFMSVMEGAGYLVLTPFGVGDTGSTADAYGLPAVVVWSAFAIAVAITLWLAWRFATPAVRHTAGDLTSLRAFTFYPWIAGTLVAVALTGLDLALASEAFTGGDVFAVLMGTVALGVFAPMAMPFTQRLLRRDPGAAGSELLRLPRMPIVGLVVIMLITVLNLAVLSQGLNVG